MQVDEAMNKKLQQFYSDYGERLGMFSGDLLAHIGYTKEDISLLYRQSSWLANSALLNKIDAAFPGRDVIPMQLGMWALLVKWWLVSKILGKPVVGAQGEDE